MDDYLKNPSSKEGYPHMYGHQWQHNYIFQAISLVLEVADQL